MSSMKRGSDQKRIRGALMSAAKHAADVAQDESIAYQHPESAFFQPKICRERLEAAELSVPSETRDTVSLFDDWLKSGYNSSVIPTRIFDAEYYLLENPDVAASGMNCFEHFLIYGEVEMRCPHKSLEPIFNVIRNLEAQDKHLALRRFYQIMPTQFLDAFEPKKGLPSLENFLLPDHYRHVHEIDEDCSVAGDFIAKRILGHKETPFLFCKDHYIKEWNYLQENKNNNGFIYAQNSLYPGSNSLIYTNSVEEELFEYLDIFLHWFSIGRFYKIIPTPIFDPDYYLLKNPDLIRWKRWIFEHFIETGIYGIRKANPFFDPQEYCSKALEINPSIEFGKINPPVLHYIQGGHQFVELSDHPLNISGSINNDDQRSAMEICLDLRFGVLDDLHSDDLQTQIKHAVNIEPLITRPYGYRNLSIHPLLHKYNKLSKEILLLREEISRKSYDNLIIIPHCRMSGASRIAGALSQSIARIYTEEASLIIITDLPDFDHPEWFGSEIELLNIPSLLKDSTVESRERILLDLIRGLSPKRVFNVNSKTAWSVLENYSNQLNKYTNLYAYLFCWDYNLNNHKGGYPIQQFQTCFDRLSGVIVDNITLVNELQERYFMNKFNTCKIRNLYTPLNSGIEWNHTDTFIQRRARNLTPTCFWAGRIDRQKRFDIVIDIANKCPWLKIHAWGHTVIDNITIDIDQLPTNMRLHKPFDDFEEIPLHAVDFYLNTSEWEGLPTMLLDVGSRAIPVVSSIVGGIGEILDDATGWPVDNFLDVGTYIESIQKLLQDVKETTRRADALQERIKSICKTSLYDEQLGLFLETTS